MNNLREILDIMLIVLLLANMVTNHIANRKTNELIKFALQSNQQYLSEMTKLEDKYFMGKEVKNTNEMACGKR